MKPTTDYYDEERFKYLPEKDRILIKQEFDFLDTLDLSPVLMIAKEERFSIRKVMNYIEDIYESDYIRFTLNYCGISDSYIFNNISDSEFIEYLKVQYHLVCSTSEDFYIAYELDGNHKGKW